MSTFIQFCVGLGLVVIVGVPVSVQAAVLSEAERATLQAQIVQLQAEVIRLEALLRNRFVSSVREPYQARLFTQPIEASYFVLREQLLPTGTKRVRAQDAALFAHLVSVMGEAEVRARVGEWRVFFDPMSEVDAYVEQISDTGQYVVNINRAGFVLSDPADVRALKELFVHEYAHMIFLSRPEVVAEYRDQFWSMKDLEMGSKTTAEREQYFRQNKSDFVSEYALQSVDEDMAETFLFAVVSPVELETGERREKFDFLLKLSAVAQAISQTRARLNLE